MSAMRILYVSYYRANTFSDPHEWLRRINFFTPILSSLAKHAEVHNINVINYEGVLLQQNIHFHFLRSTFDFASRINRKVKEINPAVVIVHGFLYPHQVLRLRFSIGSDVRIFIQHHGELPLKGIRLWLQRITDRFVEGYFFTSNALAEPWIAKGMIENIEKVHEVMEVTSVFSPKVQEADDYSQSAIRNYIWVGRLDENKNPLLMAKAFGEFAKRHHDVKLFFIFQSYELLEDLKELIGKSPARDRIELVGKVEHDQMPQWYNRADYILSTSFKEGSGVAVTEAMSFGVYPVLSKIPSFSKMTNEGEMGILFECNNETALVNALESSYVMERGATRRATLAFHQQHHSADAVAAEIFRVLDSRK